ncbi:MAG: MFS transporter [Oscillospiraceae bacterium]|nr:MFS transporter [Oscillospiraceae bacterium]MBQ3500027.1 MFS transporter [Oscillospiraceae bacterium]MBQ4643573.1 MFS transporter [Oscillospiraceae bacterium]
MASFLLAIIYISFISLGLPDALLGGAWPTMQLEFGVPVSYAGIISMIICFGTIASSLMSDRMTKRFGTGKVTAVSVALTAAALFGFSVSNSFLMLCLIAIPYGLGAGGVDASINNYAAVHYASRHMSWLHCMWGIGASTGPYILAAAMTDGGWNLGYRWVSVLQVILTAVLFLTLPLWKEEKTPEKAAGKPKALSIREIFAIPGAREVMLAFFCYCALESTAGLWASSFLVMEFGISEETAAGLATLFYTGITVGRGISGFVTYKMNDKNMIRLGQAIIAVGVAAMLLPFGEKTAMAGIVLVGLGCAPIYPCVIHSTPAHFGADKSQAIIGVQMACAYIGSCFMPPVFGIIANRISAGLLPFYLGAILLLMFAAMEKLNKIKA